MSTYKEKIPLYNKDKSTICGKKNEWKEININDTKIKKDQLLVALIGHINYLLTAGVRHIKIQLNGIQYNLC